MASLKCQGLSQTGTFRGEGLTNIVAFVFLQLKLTEENGPEGGGLSAGKVLEDLSSILRTVIKEEYGSNGLYL